MSCSLSQQNQEAELTTAVTFPERVDGIQFGKEVGSLSRELFWTQLSEIMSLGELLERLLHFAVDVLWVAERALSLGDTTGPRLAGPGVDKCR